MIGEVAGRGAVRARRDRADCGHAGAWDLLRACTAESSAARALSLASGAAVRCTMSSLELLMARTASKGAKEVAHRDKDIAIAIDARRDELYFQLFDAG